jgi:hypothetical protein
MFIEISYGTLAGKVIEVDQAVRIIQRARCRDIKHSAANHATCARRGRTGDTSQPSKLPDFAMPENRPRCGWLETPPTQPRTRRGLDRRSPTCRWSIRPDSPSR